MALRTKLRAAGAEGHEHDESRRAMLAKVGKFAYAAPALALLTEPRDAIGGYRPKPKPKPKKG